MAGLVAEGHRIRPVPPPLVELLVRHLGGLRREAVLQLLFDEEGRLCGDVVLCTGSICTVAARYRQMFEQAFAIGAAGFVLAHNHPSGDPRPSARDIASTRALASMARAMEIEFLDHLIVVRDAAVSMRRAGLMPV